MENVPDAIAAVLQDLGARSRTRPKRRTRWRDRGCNGHSRFALAPLLSRQAVSPMRTLTRIWRERYAQKPPALGIIIIVALFFVIVTAILILIVLSE